MSVEAMTWAFQVPLPPCPKSVLVALANRCDEDGYCWPGVQDLERRTGWKPRSIQQAIQTLVRHRLLSVTARYSDEGRQISNLYRVSMTTISSGEGAPHAGGRVHHMQGEGAPHAGGRVHHMQGEGAPHAPKYSSEQSDEQSLEQEHATPTCESGRARTVDMAPEGFAAFWEEFPRKVGKKAAIHAWKKARDRPSIETIVQAVQSAKRSQKWREGFIPNPTTWLNQGRWDDQMEPCPVPPIVPKAFVTLPTPDVVGEACPPEVAAQLSRLFGTTFSFTADHASVKA